MSITVAGTRNNSPADVDHPAGPSDAALVAQVASVLAPPRREPADSFVLHAPLELIARSALLPYVRPNARVEARRRLVDLADGYRTASPPVAAPRRETFESPQAAAVRLVAAIDRGELDDVDAVASWLGQAASACELRALLAEAVIPRLGAAAHAPIFLFQLPRVAPRGQISPELLRGLARELARVPDWRLHWLDERTPRAVSPTAATPDTVWDALAAVPQLGRPQSDFIFPLMSRIDTATRAPVWLGAVTGDGGPTADMRERGRAVLRAAAWSMLLEPPDHAPYGWSHCLTMPQAVLGIASDLSDPSMGLAVAATYVAGFRASLAQRPLVAEEPKGARATDPALDDAIDAPIDDAIDAPFDDAIDAPFDDAIDAPFDDAIDAGPAAAAAVVWATPEVQVPDLVTILATRAAVHPDAHLVKYTLACFDAAAADPSHARLFLAAAASLSSWWATIGTPDAA